MPCNPRQTEVHHCLRLVLCYRVWNEESRGFGAEHLFNHLNKFRVVHLWIATSHSSLAVQSTGPPFLSRRGWLTLRSLNVGIVRGCRPLGRRLSFSVLTIPVAHWAVLRLGSHLENEFGVLKAVDNSPEFIQEDILLDIRVIE